MLASLAVVTILAAANAVPQVAVLPFVAGPGVSKKQAAGVTALFRNKIEEVDFLELIKTRRDDAKTVKKCKKDPKCFGEAAFTRGAQMLVWGEVTPKDSGFGIYLLVYEPKALEATRQVIGDVVGGEDDIDDRLARMIREACAPEALAGGIVVHGDPEGASVYLDDKLAGELPLPPRTGIVEGEYVLRVEKEGYYPHTRPVAIRFGEISMVNVTLVSKRKKFAESKVFNEAEEDPGVNLVGPIAVAAAGAVVGVVAAGLGTVSLLDSLEVERRAATNNLLFPRDTDLIQRGRLFATLSTVGWAASAAVFAGAGGWAGAAFALAPTSDAQARREKSDAADRLDAPAEGSPEADEMIPQVVVP